ncbi:DUF4383 domain-containing protein [Halobacteriales archaeon QS_1_68_20]|nr:MAG: DUF4383 domain-containing protein [Halobacteriales archaeon QS_1_68_20]
MATEPASGESTRIEPFVAMAVGGILIAVGVLAPVVAGERGAFVVFGRNYLHDLVRLITGAAAFWAGYFAGGQYASNSAIVLGALYLVVTVLGIVYLDVLRELLALNTADNALHLVLAVLLLGTGLVFGAAEDQG